MALTWAGSGLFDKFIHLSKKLILYTFNTIIIGTISSIIIVIISDSIEYSVSALSWNRWKIHARSLIRRLAVSNSALKANKFERFYKWTFL